MLCDLRPARVPPGNFAAPPLSHPDVPVVSAAQPVPASPAVRAHRHRGRLQNSLGALLGVCALFGACAHKSSQTAPKPPPEAIGFSDAPLLGAQSGPTRAAASQPSERVARLDRLLDLFDAARFAEDQGARESLWEGLGGASMGRGHGASREALARLLDEALALDELPGLSEDEREFVASVLQLLTADLHRPAVAEDLSIQTAAYRELVSLGHPRIVDNARWRIYDHVRGCLVGAISAPPDRRPEIAVHSLYVANESIEDYLDDSHSVHVRPPPPTPDELWALLDSERQALAAIDRWAPVLDHRAAADEELRLTAAAALPAPRDPNWQILSMPTGTGRSESQAPIIRVDGQTLVIDEGRPQERREALGSPGAARALAATLVQDGRGIVLFVAPPMTPSPNLRTALRALLSAHVATVEFAIREPRVGEGESDVILALPLEVVRDSDRGPAALALRGARLHMHLDGRGPRLAIDGRWLSTRSAGPRELNELLANLARAYPREHMITLSIGSDVLLQQLVDLLRALTGGPERRYDVAAWSVDLDPTAIREAKPIDAEDRRVERRAKLYSGAAMASIKQPFPLPGGDQGRLEALAHELVYCLPEAESALPSSGLQIHLSFEEGRIREFEVGRLNKRGKKQKQAIEACIGDESHAFRLREQRDPVKIDIVLRP